jgi:WD40 repeat protein
MTVKLRRKLSSDGAWITRLAWSPDGRRLAAGCGDNKVRVWDIESGEVTVLSAHTEVVSSVAWAPNGRLASGSADKTVRIWNLDERREIKRSPTYSGFVRCVAWENDQVLISGGEDDRVVVWTLGAAAHGFQSQEGWVLSLAASPGKDGGLAVGHATGLVSVRRFGKDLHKRFKGHTKWVDSLAWTPDGKILVSGSGDKTIRVWDAATRKTIARLEGHTAQVRAVAISADGRLLASKADDYTVALWDMKDWRLVRAVAADNGHEYWPPGIAFHPSLPILATPDGNEILLLDIDVNELLGVPPPENSIKYIAAKIALVGDSGVGKTTLGFRLAHGKYDNHPSTHGQQFWVIDQLRTQRADNTECEAVLWDFAGQPDYRLVHALFMDDVDLALILFDPTKPLEGVRYWLKQLAPKGERRQAMLVAARADRGASTLTPAELQAFCAAEGVTAGYLTTSALTGEGLEQLLERVKASVAWESMPATITTATFKRIKEHVLQLKEHRGKTFLVTPEELRQRLQESDPDWKFTDAEMMTAVKHLATHGYVSALRASNGVEVILLAPELLAGVASSIVLEARRNPRGLGAVDEQFILHGDFQPREVESLSPADRTLLVDAAVVLFLEHNICFRQTVGAQTFLIFPALINEKRPQLPDANVVEYVSYRITGAVENVYASLVVQLGYTGTFSRTNQWQNQAEYETPAGDMCGFRQTEEAEGQMELVLYHARDKARARVLFQELVEMFLRGRDIAVQKFEAIVCGNCGYRPQRAEIISRITAGKDHLFCANCGTRLPLAPAVGEAPAAHPAARDEGAVAQRRTNFEAALVRIKAIVRDTNRKTPSCFLSYAWGNPDEERWVAELANDLRHAGIDVVLDQNDNQNIGASIARFIARIPAVDFVAVVGTPGYYAKYENTIASTGSVVAAEVDLINQRLLSTEEKKATVLPLLLKGDEESSLPPLLRGRVYADFRKQANYFRAAFDLALTMYRIDQNGGAVADVRETLGRS